MAHILVGNRIEWVPDDYPEFAPREIPEECPECGEELCDCHCPPKDE